MMKTVKMFLILLVVAPVYAADPEPASPPSSPPAPSSAAPSVVGDASSINFSEVEAFLTKLEVDRESTRKARAEAVEKRLKAAMKDEASLINAYKEAYIDVNFEGSAKDSAKAKDWYDKNKTTLQDDCFVWVLQMHALYLQATIVKKQGEDEKALKLLDEWFDRFPKAEGDFEKFRKHDTVVKKATPTQQALNAVNRSGTERYKSFVKQEIFSQGVARSVFLRADKATFLADDISNWYLGDLSNYPEIHRMNVIAYFREKKDPRIFAAWEKNVKLEQYDSEYEGLVHKKADFVANRKPFLILLMAKDYAAFGKQKEAVKMMMDVLKESPNCKEAKDFVTEIRRIIAEAKK